MEDPYNEEIMLKKGFASDRPGSFVWRYRHTVIELAGASFSNTLTTGTFFSCSKASVCFRGSLPSSLLSHYFPLEWSVAILGQILGDVYFWGWSLVRVTRL